MTCRHKPGDRSCETQFPRPREILVPAPEPTTPDKFKYSIVDSERIGAHLVLKVLYPNCKKCSYEGNKVLVYLNVAEKDVLRWKEIDPHFAAPPSIGSRRTDQAPSPAARFPASPEGWKDAIEYCKSKK